MIVVIMCAQCLIARRQVISVNGHYPCNVLKHRGKVEDQQVVHKRGSVVLVEKALLGTF